LDIEEGEDEDREEKATVASMEGEARYMGLEKKKERSSHRGEKKERMRPIKGFSQAASRRPNTRALSGRRSIPQPLKKKDEKGG